MFFRPAISVMMADEEKKNNISCLIHESNRTSQKRCSPFTHHIITLQINNTTMTLVDYNIQQNKRWS